MDDLVRWLGEQLDIDTARAKACPGNGEWNAGDIGFYGPELSPEVRAHMAEHDPARVLREVEAKRRILERYELAMKNRRAHPDDLASAGALLALHGVVKLLALPYAGRSGYEEALASAE